MKIGRVAVHQFTSMICISRKKLVCTAMNFFNRIVTRKDFKWFWIKIDGDISHAGGLRCMIAPPPRWVSI